MTKKSLNAIESEPKEINSSQIFVAVEEFKLISKRRRSSDFENLLRPARERKEMIQLSSNAKSKNNFCDVFYSKEKQKFPFTGFTLVKGTVTKVYFWNY